MKAIPNTRLASSRSGRAKTISPLLVWSAQNSDLNPIEHLLEELERRIRTRKYKKKIEQRQEIKEEWTKIPANRISTLIDSMPKRCADVIHFLGFPLVIDLNFVIAIFFGIKKAKK